MANTCWIMCQKEIKQMLIGTERAFKGLGILFFIYGLGSFVAYGLISQLTRVHLAHDDDEDNNKIRDKCDTFNVIALICGVVFWVISFISFCLMKKYKGVIGMTAQEILHGNKGYQEVDNAAMPTTGGDQ